MTAITQAAVVQAPSRPRRSRLARLVGLAAPAAAAAYGLAALGWAVTGRGYPFEAGYPDSDQTLVRAVPAQVGAPVLAGLLLVLAAVLAWTARTPRPDRRARAVVLGYGYGTAAVLAVGLAGIFPLAITGYGPMLPVLLLLGAGGMDWHSITPYPGMLQLAAVATGILVGLAVLGWQWRTAGRCDRCGLAAGERPDRARWARIGRWAVAVSVVIPALYAISRLAWVVNIPLGISQEMLRDLHTSHGVWAGFGLGSFALLGSLLTLGLVQRWGEVFPAWTPPLRGRRVPIALAVVPAGLVSVLSFGAGISAVTSEKFLDGPVGSIGATAPALLWPLWGLALAVATVAYARRRQEPCRHLDR